MLIYRHTFNFINILKKLKDKLMLLQIGVKNIFHEEIPDLLF
jgi:hypothetical protein